MKLLLYIIAEWFADIINYFSKLGKPKPVPSLLALNIDWFTYCNWREQMVAFGQLHRYYYNK
jgi:hypothetical protein